MKAKFAIEDKADLWRYSTHGKFQQTATSLGNCPPKAEVRGSNPFGRAS
jgi:hypothetical protein